jgi:hypothetical protein
MCTCRQAKRLRSCLAFRSRRAPSGGSSGGWAVAEGRDGYGGAVDVAAPA